MPRYALKIEYDGTPFCGWQAQQNLPSVQNAIQEALSKLENRKFTIVAAGRTDAGVHAFGQVAHCDMHKKWDSFRLSEALNYHLKPLPISIISTALVDDEWHARFSAIERHYIYRLFSRRAPAILESARLWQVKNPLNLCPMQTAACHLIGQHDFTTFRASICQASSPIKTLDCLDIRAKSYQDGTLFTFDIRARSFLHNQVRSIVGSLERVGAGAWKTDRIFHALNAKNRAECGPVAPSSGLYLAYVRYAHNPFA